MFSGLPNLDRLQLQENLIHTIEYQSFKDNVALTELYLHRNLLQTLPECIFTPEHTENLEVWVYDNDLSCNQSLCWLMYAQEDWITINDQEPIVCTGPGVLNGSTWDGLTTLDLNCAPPGEFQGGCGATSRPLLGGGVMVSQISQFQRTNIPISQIGLTGPYFY